jgi:membrane peptidoglycan carboxypeptidase
MATSGRNRRRIGALKRRRGAGLRRSGAAKGLPRWISALLVAGIFGFIGLMIAFVAAYAYYQKYADKLVAPDELAINQPSYGAKIYDRTGKLLYEYVDDKSGLRRPVKLESVSDAFLAATIATEDDSFFTNPGINIKGLARAVTENLPIVGGKGLFEGSGGSSITQQLVKNVYIPPEERQKRSVDRKAKEIVDAIELTNRYSKEQILEWYVNQISYGGVYNGVEAASEGYFGKPARDLTLAEAALLAGIPQSPAEYDPVNHPDNATARRDQILDLMQKQGKIRIGENKYFEITEEQLAAAKAEPISISVKRFPIEAPHFVLQYVEPQLIQLFGKDALYHDGLVVTTTLDLDLQNEAQANLERRIVAPAPGSALSYEQISNSHNGAVVVMDPKTGEILTMVGSRDYFREDIQGKNNNATALNSPGSSLKPFVYMTSFMTLGWGPGTYALDTPVSFKQVDGSEFSPTNPGKNYQGLITLRNALGNSLNVVADKVADQTGVQNVVNVLKKAGFTTITGSYGPAIATGGVDITQLDEAYGFTVLANGGIMRGMQPLTPHRTGERTLDPISILKVEDAQHRVRFDVNPRRAEQRVFPEEYPYLITSILTDPNSQCITFGCGGIAIPGVAVKTGTSEPYDPKGPNAGKIGETWSWGYTPDVVVGIWAGNSDQTTPGPFSGPVVNIFSTSIAYRSMADTISSFYKGKPKTPFKRPETVIELTECVPSGLKPTPLCGKTTTDLFAKEKEPKTDDNFWQQVRVDGRTGLLAGPGTPPQYIQTQVMLVIPPDLMKTEDDRKRWQEWADALGVPLAPTDASPATGGGGAAADLPAVIFSPTAGQNVGGVVQVIGRASSANFVGYVLEYGSGVSPNGWTPIAQGNAKVESGPLGTWNTQGLAPGPYTLRLVVQDRQRGQMVATVTVNVGAPTPTPVATPTPPARP